MTEYSKPKEKNGFKLIIWISPEYRLFDIKKVGGGGEEGGRVFTNSKQRRLVISGLLMCVWMCVRLQQAKQYNKNVRLEPKDWNYGLLCSYGYIFFSLRRFEGKLTNFLLTTNKSGIYDKKQDFLFFIKQKIKNQLVGYSNKGWARQRLQCSLKSIE